jgi:hypothetical protein
MNVILTKEFFQSFKRTKGRVPEESSLLARKALAFHILNLYLHIFLVNNTSIKRTVDRYTGP